MPSILITGANRGIGKRLAELYDADGWTVFAASRDPARCDAPGEKIALDVTDDASVAAAAQSLSGRPVDVLWNNAGVYLDKNMTLDQLDLEKWEETFRVNTIGPIRLARALMDNVAKSDLKTLAFTTSRMGSISLLSRGAYAYRSSKTALNMAVAVLTKDVAPLGLKTVLLHPGWVRTDMGGGSADIDTDASASGMKTVVDTLDMSRSGKFLNYDGMEFSW